MPGARNGVWLLFFVECGFERRWRAVPAAAVKCAIERASFAVGGARARGVRRARDCIVSVQTTEWSVRTRDMQTCRDAADSVQCPMAMQYVAVVCR